MHLAATACHRDLPYSPTRDAGRLGDLFLPGIESTRPPVLLIHGGGWNALSKESVEPLTELFVQAGRAVFSINYRLLDQAPWPACGDDCLAAAFQMLRGGFAAHGLPAPARLLICGASAGGHLAMMTSLRLPPENAEAVISLAGPSRLQEPEGRVSNALAAEDFLVRFFGSENLPLARVAAASPALCAGPGAPPLFCIHSRNDRVVSPIHSQQAVEAWRRAGAVAELLTFDGIDEQHGFWDGTDPATRRLNDQTAALIRKVLQRLH